MPRKKIDTMTITKNKDGPLSTWKKTFVSTRKRNKGEVVEHSYEFNPEVKSKNEQLSDSIRKTMKEFNKEAQEVVEDKFYKKLKPMLGSQIRYICKDKNGNIKARLGGALMVVDPDYMMLKNMNNHVAWSVQFDNLLIVYKIKGPLTLQEKKDLLDAKLKKKMEKEEKQAAIAERKKLRLERKAKLEKEKEEKAKEKELKKKKSITKEEKAQIRSQKKEQKEKEYAKLLNEYYYKKDMKFGRDKLHHTIKQDGHKIARDYVGKWLSEQKLHQLTKKVEKVKNTQIIQSKAPFNVMNLDLVEIDGKPVMHIIDSFSRKAFGRVMPNKTQKSVITALKYVFKNDDFKPRMIISDNGPEFTGQNFREFLKDLDIKHQTTTSHNPQANGKIERLNGTIKRLYEKMELSEPEVEMNQTTLDKLLKAYNNSTHSVIKMAPGKAIEAENVKIVKAVNDRRENTNLSKQKDDLEVGDKVRIVVKHESEDSKKYRPNWSEETYKIKSIRRPRQVLVNPIQYKISGGPRQSRGYYKRDELQKITAVKSANKAQPKFIIDKFIDMKRGRALVRWKGYTKENDSWEPIKNLRKDVGKDVIDELIDEYENSSFNKKS